VCCAHARRRVADGVASLDAVPVIDLINRPAAVGERPDDAVRSHMAATKIHETYDPIAIIVQRSGGLASE
jgi:hypothetical protein